MKKRIINVLILFLLFFSICIISNADEGISINKDNLSLFVNQSYILEVKLDDENDYISSWKIEKTDTSIVNSNSSGNNNIGVSLNIQSDYSCKVYVSDFYASSGDFIIRATSNNGKEVTCNLFIPKQEEVFGSLNSYSSAFQYYKVGDIIDFTPTINLDAQIIIDDSNINSEYFEKINDYQFKVIKVGQSAYIKYSNTVSWTIYTYDYTIFEFKNSDKIFINEGECVNIELNCDVTSGGVRPFWSSSNNSILSIISTEKINTEDVDYLNGTTSTLNIDYNNITFFARKPGTVIITVGLFNTDIKITKEVEVVRPIKIIKFNTNSLELNVNDTYSLITTINPIDATYTDITWNSSNEKVAIVDENGKITAMKSGLSVITATGYGDVKETCIVLVSDNSTTNTTINNIILTTLPVTSYMTFFNEATFDSILNITNFPILDYGGYRVKLYSSITGEEKEISSLIGSKDLITIENSNEILATYTIVVKGDTNGDGKIKMYDAFQILKSTLFNSESLDEIDILIRDYNNDGEIKMYDSFAFLKQTLF